MREPTSANHAFQRTWLLSIALLAACGSNEPTVASGVDAGSRICTPGHVQSCYDGLVGTDGVGPCHGGTQTCNTNGTAYGICMAQVIPSDEICANGVDEDCSGTPDDVPDTDGDGWTRCDGDCCELAADCTAPTLVNPGAYDWDANATDDDCDGAADNAAAACDTGLSSNSSNGTDYGRALDLCRTTTESPTLATKTWGLIAASFALADGTGTPSTDSRSIRPAFGANIEPRAGSSLVVLSTGNAAATAQTNPSFSSFASTSKGTSSSMPSDWVLANGGNVPGAPSCFTPAPGTVYDPVLLKLRMRVPTNAQAFEVEGFFLAADFPEWVCSSANDYFLALLSSSYTPATGEPANPADGNLAFYRAPNDTIYPMGVNLASGNTGLFSACVGSFLGCSAGFPGNISTCTNGSLLAGTGFDVATPGTCETNSVLGGGTGWLKLRGNVVPGEVIELRLVIWDTVDAQSDSLVLLDNFRWLPSRIQVGLTP